MALVIVPVVDSQKFGGFGYCTVGCTPKVCLLFGGFLVIVPLVGHLHSHEKQQEALHHGQALETLQCHAFQCLHPADFGTATESKNTIYKKILERGKQKSY